MKSIHLSRTGTCVECNTEQRMDVNGIIEKHQTAQGKDCEGSERPSSKLPKPVDLHVVK